MAKMKTHRGAAKRFRLTGSGKVKYHKSNKRHLATGKTRKRKRHLRQPITVSKSFEANIKKLLPR